MNLKAINGLITILSIVLLNLLKRSVGKTFWLESLNKNSNIENELFSFSYTYLETWIPEWNKIEKNFQFNLLHDPEENKSSEKIDDYKIFSKLKNNKEKIQDIICRIVILTAGNDGFNTIIELERNRINYSKKHKYCYIHFTCKEEISSNFLHEENKKYCILPHFWRYLGIWKLFTRNKIITNNNKVVNSKEIKWILYMDLDAMFTNYEYRIEEIINKYSTITTGIIIAADTKCYIDKYPINNGVILFKNNNFSRQLVFQVLSKQKYRGSLLFEGHNKWNAKGLKDQPLLTNILVEDKNEIDSERILKYCTFAMKNNLDITGIIYASDHVTIVSPRTMNSVRRSFVHFRMDNILWHWRSGDWIAHLSGLTPMASSLRKKYIKQVCDSSPDEVCPFQISINSTELVIVENKISLVRYKKELKAKNTKL